MPMKDLLARIDAIPMTLRGPNLKEADALLGLVDPPAITVTQSLELFWGLTEDRIVGKSQDQVRRWQNPRKKAVANFVGVVGDLALKDLTQDTMLDFRDWWWEKIKSEGLSPDSGNKDITYITNIFRTINTMKRLNLPLPLDGLSFKSAEKITRPPFSTAWIKEKLIPLVGMNAEARAVFLGMVNTGYRPPEGAELRPEHIRLDTEIPHICIEPVGRTLKTQSSRRVIPLAGISLEVFREFPDGFPRYRDSDALSATVNKFLRENGLLETPKHSMYRLRHAFEDRMLAVGVDERVRMDLFGHSLDRERYGAGASLEHKHRVVQSVAL